MAVKPTAEPQHGLTSHSSLFARYCLMSRPISRTSRRPLLSRAWAQPEKQAKSRIGWSSIEFGAQPATGVQAMPEDDADDYESSGSAGREFVAASPFPPEDRQDREARRDLDRTLPINVVEHVYAV
jgi:hypothetical protein